VVLHFDDLRDFGDVLANIRLQVLEAKLEDVLS